MPLPHFNSLRKSRVGLTIAGAQLQLVVLEQQDTQRQPVLADNMTFSDLGELGAQLKIWVKQHKLRGTETVLSIGADYYRLHLTDLPKVPVEERNAALTIALRDVIDAPLSDAVVESFLLPASLPRSSERVYAVIAQTPRLRPLAQTINGAGLALHCIEIPELSAVRLLPTQNIPHATSALLLQTSRGVALYLYIGDDLVLSRPLLGINDLQHYASQAIAGDPGEQLLLEIQRTLDYFESQLARRPVAKLFIQPLATGAEELGMMLSQQLNTAVQVLGLPAASNGLPTLAAAWLAVAAGMHEVRHAAH